VNLVALAILVAVAAGDSDQPLTKPVAVKMVAVEASLEKRGDPEKDRVKQIERGLEDIKSAVDDLRYNLFKKVNVVDKTAKPHQEVELPIDKKFTLFVTPHSKDQENRIKIEARVMEKVLKPAPDEQGEKEELRKALTIRSAVAADKPLRIGGFKLKEGELVLILSVREKGSVLSR